MRMHMRIHMVKVISLSESAYAEMKAMKREGESFSDVVHRITRKEGKSLLDFAGALKESSTDWEKIERELYDSRKRVRMRDVRL